MPRPPIDRHVGWAPRATMFKPAGVPAAQLQVSTLSVDEVEALRLVDGEGLDQAAAAERMKVSRATVGRILARGRKKTARALTAGQALAIEPGAAGVQYYGPGRGGRRRGGGRRGFGRGRGCGPWREEPTT